MGSVRWRTAIGRPLFFFSQEITIHLIKKDKGVMEDKKLTMPMIALRGLTVLPQMTVNFDIIRDKSIAAVEQAMVGDQRVFLATQKQPDEVIPDIDGIFQVGTIGYVKQLVKMPGGMVRVTVEGQERAELLEMEKGEACCTAIVEILDPVEDDLDTIQKEAMLRILKEKLEEYGKLNVAAGREVLSPLIAQPDLTELMNQISAQFPWNYEARQSVLECRTLTEMYETELQLLLTELEVYRVKREFQTKVKAALDKNQRDYILREQLRVIREELGEENPVSDADEMKEQLKKIKASVEVKERIRKEINRFQNMPAGSQDANVIRTYLETVLELPWNKMTKDNASLKHAEEILEADHYGLEKVKERVLEYLAVRILTKKGTSPILCLVGPPGTGKTSIARSIAKAMGRKYVRISLGGVRDEAEIRGHRKTYVGAMPGRIVEGLKQAGVANPLMLLDEIDKVSSDYKGDTSSALLEVLDSEQNVKFRDHYVEIPIDLSEVLFIATANTTQTIPGPLLDRMELIEVSGYITEEKIEIARRHLVPKELEANGMKKNDIKIPKNTLEAIIENYTRESGVRELEKKIGKILRKSARQYATDGYFAKTEIKPGDLYEFLGAPEYTRDKYQGNEYAGVVTGLAWTAVGGEILFVETSLSRGKGGRLTLTGNLGDVMKESAMLALEYIKAHASLLNLDEEIFDNWNIHVHVPEGAIPKDGPSAGITMATSLASALTQKKVKANLAMTGEITLRGKVLPVGGIKEKILAAKRAGIKEIILSDENRKNIEEIQDIYLKGLTFHYVKDIKEVFAIALTDEKVADAIDLSVKKEKTEKKEE